MMTAKINPIDKKIINIVKFIKTLGRPEQRRLYASIYYEIGPVNDLMEAGWPNAVQHDYPETFPEE